MGIYRRYKWLFRGFEFYYEITWPDEYLSYLEQMNHYAQDEEDLPSFVYNDPFKSELSDFLEQLIDLGAKYIDFREEKDILEFLLSFVQHLNYYDEIGDYPRYPMETIIDGGGDCEDSAILMAFICWKLGYDYAFLLFGDKGFLGIGGWAHIDLGIAPRYSGEFNGSYWVGDDGNRYYYISCNGRGRTIGYYDGYFGNVKGLFKL